MNDANAESNDRRAKCLAYGLLVVAAMTFTFEMGRQRGVIDGQREAYERDEAQVVASLQLFDELNRRRAGHDVPPDRL
jgi:hypothetical protein